MKIFSTAFLFVILASALATKEEIKIPDDLRVEMKQSFGDNGIRSVVVTDENVIFTQTIEPADETEDPVVTSKVYSINKSDAEYMYSVLSEKNFDEISKEQVFPVDNSGIISAALNNKTISINMAASSQYNKDVDDIKNALITVSDRYDSGWR